MSEIEYLREDQTNMVGKGVLFKDMIFELSQDMFSKKEEKENSEIGRKWTLELLTKKIAVTSSSSPTVKTPRPLQGAWVPSLAEELRSHMLCSEAKNIFNYLCLNSDNAEVLGY